MAREEKESWDDEKIKRFLGKQTEVELRVSKALDDLEQPFIVMVLVEPKNYATIKNIIISKYNTNSTHIIYISLNTSYQKFLKDTTEEKKPIDNIHFIDMISVNSGARIIDSKNTAYVNSPAELTECILILEKKLEELEGKNTFVVLDSVTTVSVYNDPAVVEKFIHVLIGKASSFNASALLLSPDYDESRPITETVEQFMDKTVRI